MVRSNKVAQKRLTEPNGTPAMDFGCKEIRKRRYKQAKNKAKQTNSILIPVSLLMCQCVQKFIFGKTIVFIYLFVHMFDYV